VLGRPSLLLQIWYLFLDMGGGIAQLLFIVFLDLRAQDGVVIDDHESRLAFSLRPLGLLFLATIRTPAIFLGLLLLFLLLFFFLRVLLCRPFLRYGLVAFLFIGFALEFSDCKLFDVDIVCRGVVSVVFFGFSLFIVSFRSLQNGINVLVPNITRSLIFEENWLGQESP